jgi:hypothetical protein
MYGTVVIEWMKSPLENREDILAKVSESSEEHISSSSITSGVAIAPQSSKVSPGSSSTGGAIGQWEPRRRIHNAVRKLEGASPADVLLEDLALNMTVKKENVYEKIADIVRMAAKMDAKGSLDAATTSNGDVRDHTGKTSRSRRKEGAARGRDLDATVKEDLTVGEQIDALLSLATDPNILMRQWVGLLTWY